MTFGNGASQAFTYDPVSRLASLGNSLTDSNDLSATFAYDPASWIRSTTRTGDAYAWTGHFDQNTPTTTNGLNELATVGGVAASYDARGNLTSEPQSGKTYGYSSENLLTSASGGVALAYDPMLRLYQTAGAATTRFAYDGGDAIAEYNGSNALQRRFVFDPTTDQPVLWYEGTGTAASNRRYLSTDERGSVISVSGSTGAAIGIDTYDEYGQPGASNIGRFQYTGQMWVPETGAYHFPNRDLDADEGRFDQTDPIGPVDSPNLYPYALNNPVNLVDPLGLSPAVMTGLGPSGCIVCNAVDKVTVTNGAVTSITVTGQFGADFGGGAAAGGAGGFGQGLRLVSENGGAGGDFDCPIIDTACLASQPTQPQPPSQPQPKPTQTQQCGATSDWLGAAKTALDYASTGADIAGTAAAIGGLAAATVPPLAIGLEVFGGTMKVVSVGAGFLSAGISLYEHDYSSATGSALGAVAGAWGGKGLVKYGRLVGKSVNGTKAEIAATGVSQALSRGMRCH